MKKLLFYIFTFFYIFSYSQGTKCPLSNLANDLVGANDQFKSILNTNEGFDAYKILNIDAPNLRTNIDELKDVSNHLENIVSAGGYLKWKTGNLIGDLFPVWTRTNVENKSWVSYINESGIPDIKEINQLEALGNIIQKKMIGLERSPKNGAAFPGVDAIIDGGNSLSLKTAVPGKEGKRLREMITKANKLNDGSIAGHDEWKGFFNRVDGMITTKESSKNYVKGRWESILKDKNVNSEIIETLYIEAKDGWLKWNRSSMSWSEL